MPHEEIPFWPKAGVFAYLTGAPSTQDVFTRHFLTHGFTELVAQLECDCRIAHDANSSITVTPQISNDGVNWEDLAAVAFSSISYGGVYPYNELKQISQVASFMRFKIELIESMGGAAGIVGGTIMIRGIARRQ